MEGWFVTPSGQPADRVIIQLGKRTIVCSVNQRLDVMTAHPGKVLSPDCGFFAHFLSRPGLKRLVIIAEHQGKSWRLAVRYLNFQPKLQSWQSEPQAPNTAESLNSKIKLRNQLQSELEHFFKAQDQLNFSQASDRPRLSILIVVWNHAELTLACLKSLQTATSGLDCEILIWDNASEDKSKDLWPFLKGIQINRSPTNLGFLRAVNQLATQARGDYLLLLNNDATLGPGALDHALESMERKPNIGAVGGRVVLPDGLIQEAGNTIWNDGSCQGYGRGLEPQDHRVLDWKYTDYVSGVFLLTPRKTFTNLGGFDEGYAPAYYEDTDYCARLWQRGLHVVYDPRIIVNHYEFGSATTTANALQQQRINQRYFAQKHAGWLSAQPTYDANGGISGGLRRSAYRGHVLIIDDHVPTPHQGAGAPRMVAILDHLVKEGWKITFHPLRHALINRNWLDRRYGNEVRILTGLGRTQLASFLQQNLDLYDCFWISRPHNMDTANPTLEALSGPRVRPKIIYDAEAIYCLRNISKARLTHRPLHAGESARLISEEVGLAANAHHIVTVSPSEAAYFDKAYGREKTCHVLSHTCGETRPLETGFDERSGFLFIGRLVEDQSPNTDSIRWFLQEVYPLMDPQRRPECIIIGDARSASLGNLKLPGVRFLGPVDDLTPYYAKARVFIAPTRFGAGIPIKVIEATAHQLPVVCTPMLAGQLEWTHGKETMVAASPAEFADQCMRLHNDPELWNTLRENAVAHYKRAFSPARFAESLNTLFSAAGGHPPAKNENSPQGCHLQSNAAC